MSKPINSGALEERRKLLTLLDRMNTVDRQVAPKGMLHDAIFDRWLHGDADTRRKIEEEIGRNAQEKSN